MKSQLLTSLRYLCSLLFIFLWLSVPTPAQDQKGPTWIATRTLPAPEAHQAAAATDQFIFAIASKTIAKYDRATGDRIATSSGDAQHLNSGFFHAGKLYCAHSNYPQKPERSEIKVLDVETMQLSTFKDFGNYGGSLTWSIRHNNHWWCNFARYAADNSQTFLVEFDDQWRELRRYTFPKEVISQIGTMSLSGGVWKDNSLLVTDHDHLVLYEVALPADGTVLKYVKNQPAPFTGQGIALDPATGGLVGINRAKKQIIFAQPK
jgi:hypothetical protein